MEEQAKKLLKAGFVKREKEDAFKKLTIDEVRALSEEDAANYADQEEMEVEKGIIEKTDFPATDKRYRFIRESSKISMEETYFWILSQIKQAHSFHHFIKIKDLFAASEQSSMFGNAQQRLAAQQDKASQYLAVIGKMVKEIFQLVRELRILDERIKLYDDANKGDVASEVTLKGIWIDLVEGGSKNPASVYGMAREVGFTTLPDLFFDTNVKKSEEVDKKVDSTDFNRKVKEVLKRKLKTYLLWKENTYGELATKRTFTLRYMRQHYDAIKMYMEWVKPYLNQIKRLMMDESKLSDVNIVSAFEGSMIDVEFLAVKKDDSSFGKYRPCIIATFNYRTIPSLNYHAENYQRGPIHVGRVECTLRGYAWTDEQIAAYQKYREDEAFDVLTSIDSSLKEAMDSLGDSMKKYLEEAGEKFEKEVKKEEKEKHESMLDPFLDIFRGFGEIFGAFLGNDGTSKDKKKSADDEFKNKEKKKTAEKEVLAKMAATYINYKKAHSMMAW